MFEGLRKNLKAHFEDMAGTGPRNRLIGTLVAAVVGPDSGRSDIVKKAEPLMDYIARHKGDVTAYRLFEGITEQYCTKVLQKGLLLLVNGLSGALDLRILMPQGRHSMFF